MWLIGQLHNINNSECLRNMWTPCLHLCIHCVYGDKFFFLMNYNIWFDFICFSHWLFTCLVKYTWNLTHFKDTLINGFKYNIYIYVHLHKKVKCKVVMWKNILVSAELQLFMFSLLSLFCTKPFIFIDKKHKQPKKKSFLSSVAEQNDSGCSYSLQIKK